MKALFVSAALLLVIYSCNSKRASESDKADAVEESGWTSLFDGNTTKGWHSYGKEKAGSAWKIEDGVLFLDTSYKDGWQVLDGGDIITDEEYSDFHLKLEWKISKGGNSGIIFFIHEDTSLFKYSWESGLEMQILDNDGHPDAQFVKHRAGDLYDLIVSSEEAAKPAGEWNQVEIICKDARLEMFLNGAKVVSTTLWDEKWAELVSESKFKDMEGFGAYNKGKIGLQDHGDKVWFRNIYIKKI